MPVFSPLSLGAIVHGTGATFSAAAADRARQRVTAWLQADDSAREVLLVDSGTSALTLALRSTQGATRRPVAIPAFCCFDIATAIDGSGVPFVFYDVDPATLGPDLASLRTALASGADRILVVHLYGIPVDLDEVSTLAREFGAVVIEDAAQGVGGAWRDRPLGAHGSLGVFSFGRGKGLTGGRGGALVGNDDAGRRAVEACRASVTAAGPPVRELITITAQWALARRHTYWIPSALPFLGLGETPYHAPHAVASISDFAAAVVAENLTSVTSEARTRVQNASALLACVDPERMTRVRIPSAGLPGYLRLPLVVRSEGGRNRSPERGLGIAPGYPCALPDLAGFGGRAATSAEAPGARQLATQLLTLPVHGALSRHDLRALERWLRT